MVLDGTTGVVRVETPDIALDSIDLTTAFGVTVDVGGSTPVARLAFDGLGIGRIASRTVVLERGAASAGVVVSSYGRVARR